MENPSESRPHGAQMGASANRPSERTTKRLKGIQSHLNETPIQVYGPYLHPRSVQLGVTERTALPMNTQPSR